jgi:hypothetical protein
VEFRLSLRLDNEQKNVRPPKSKTETRTDMKKRNQILLHELNVALFKEDPHNPATAEANNRVTASGDGTVEGDFIMHSDSSTCMGCQVGYNERVAGGPGSSTTRPIHHEDEPERAILLMDLPKPESDWTMRLSLNNGELKDEVELSTENGTYDEMFTEMTKQFPPVHQEKGSFFTVLDVGLNQYVTIMNANQPDMVIRIATGKKNTFDVFRVSFLVLAK